MKNSIRIIAIGFFGLAFFGLQKGAAQIRFQLSKLADGETYQVSAIPEKSWAKPQNIVSTGQVTIKALANSLVPMNVLPGTSGARWAVNSINRKPAEASEFDYFSFGLLDLGTREMAFEKGKELVLFTFKNGKSCNAAVILADNFADPFMAPNSQQANIGQSLTVLGAGGDAFIGFVQDRRIVDCDDSGAYDDQKQEELFWTYPNPSSGPIEASAFWKGEEAEEGVTMSLIDMSGRAVYFQTVRMEPGLNRWPVPMDRFPESIYHLTFTAKSWSHSIDNLINIKH